MRPPREPIRQAEQTYFVTFQTARRTPFFRREQWCTLLTTVLQHYADHYKLHDFGIMPDHVHLLLTPAVPVERAVRSSKAAFPFERNGNSPGLATSGSPASLTIASATRMMLRGTCCIY